MDNLRTVWQEGMFLSPQHFQQQERYLEDYIRQLSSMGSGKAVGFAELVIDPEQLNIGRFMLTRCSGILPDGTPFHSESAIVRAIEQVDSGSFVYLALPALRPGYLDTAPEDSEASHACRFLSFDREVYDSSDRENEPVSLALSRLNLKLLLPDEEPDTHVRLAVARVMERQNDGRLVLDNTFIPCCLDYRVGNFLNEQVRNLQASMRSRACQMSSQVGLHAELKSTQAMQLEYLWLQSLNRYSARLMSISCGGLLSPSELHRELVTMAADLATFTQTLAPEYPNYQSQDAYQCFAPVFSALQQNLQQASSEKIVELSWDDRLFSKRRLLRTLVEDRSLFNEGRFILAVTSTIGPLRCQDLFPATAKLAGHQRIAEKVRGALNAVPLLPLQAPPVELQSKPDTAYFQVDTSHPLWQEMIETHDALALHIDEQMPADTRVALYVVR